MAAGVALTIINSRAVIEALIGYQTAFARTPKYAIGSEHRGSLQNIAVPPPQRMAALRRTGRRHVLSGDGDLRDRVVQLPGDSVPAAVRRRILLGRLHDAVGRVSGQAANGSASASWPMPLKNKPENSPARYR